MSRTSKVGDSTSGTTIDEVRLDAALVVFGMGLAMALDEWVYLIATDGSNASYPLPVSFWGGIAVVGLACAYAAGMAAVRR